MGWAQRANTTIRTPPEREQLQATGAQALVGAALMKRVGERVQKVRVKSREPKQERRVFRYHKAVK